MDELWSILEHSPPKHAVKYLTPESDAEQELPHAVFSHWLFLIGQALLYLTLLEYTISLSLCFHLDLRDYLLRLLGKGFKALPFNHRIN